MKVNNAPNQTNQTVGLSGATYRHPLKTSTRRRAHRPREGGEGRGGPRRATIGQLPGPTARRQHTITPPDDRFAEPSTRWRWIRPQIKSNAPPVSAHRPSPKDLRDRPPGGAGIDHPQPPPLCPPTPGISGTRLKLKRRHQTGDGSASSGGS